MNTITTPFADCLTNVPKKTTQLLSIAAMALVKLISGSILAPVLAIAAVLISVTRAEVMSQSSRWLLRVGVFAVGIKTDPKRVLAVEKPTNALLITETIFIAGLILLGINYIS